MKEKSFRLMKSVFVFFVMFSMIGFSIASPLSIKAVETDEKEIALNKGAAWIVARQLGTGGWTESRDPGTTSLALSALTAHAKNMGLDPLSDDYMYSENVKNALDYIFSKTTRDDSNNYVHWGSGQIYVLGPALMAITSVESPDAIVDVEGSAVDGMTHKEVAQEVVNYIYAAQIKSGTGIGMWYYNYGSLTGDISIAGWTTLGLMYAKDHFNIPIPQALLDNLSLGIDIALWDDDVDHPLYGGAGYTSSSTIENSYRYWINIHKVGHLMAMMKLVGDPIDSPRVSATRGFIERHFYAPNSGANGTSFESPNMINDYIDVGWRGGPNGNDPYPSYNGALTIMKALLSYGINTLTIDELEVDWQPELDQVILNNQDETGYWQNGGYPYQNSEQYRIYYTAWAMMTLSRSVPTIAVTGVSIDCPSKEVELGTPITLKATVSPKDATNPAVVWSSSDPSVATVVDGVVTPLKVGNTEIKAINEDSGISAKCSIQVVVKATGVTLTCLTKDLVENGDPVSLDYSFTPENATNKNVTWTSSDPTIATVTDGVVTPLKAGSTDITIKTDDGDYTAKCKVVVKEPREFVKIEIKDEDTLSVKAEKLEESVLFTADEVKQDAIIRLVVQLLEEKTVFEADKTLLKAYAKEHIKSKEHAFVYLDISLFKIIGQEQTKLTSSLEPITISFILPKELRDKDLKIFRVHGGKVDELVYEYNTDTFEITFATDEFSTYAMAYGDDSLIVDTSDQGHFGGWLLFAGLFLLLFSYQYKKEKKEEI